MVATVPQVGELVLVDTEGGKPGEVRALEADPFTPGGVVVGVALVNEKGRVDYWLPCQVVRTTPKEAAAAALKFLGRGRAV